MQINFVWSIHNAILHFSYPWIVNCSMGNANDHFTYPWTVNSIIQVQLDELVCCSVNKWKQVEFWIIGQMPNSKLYCHFSYLCSINGHEVWRNYLATWSLSPPEYDSCMISHYRQWRTFLQYTIIKFNAHRIRVTGSLQKLWCFAIRTVRNLLRTGSDNYYHPCMQIGDNFS